MASGQWSVLSSVLIALALVRPAGACTVVSIPIKVGPVFTLQVTDRGRAIAGMQVELERYEPNSDEAPKGDTILVTDNEGRVTFLDLLAGQYFVSVQRAGISASRLIEVQTAATGEPRTLIELEWPGRTVLRSQTMSGRFSAWLANTTESRMYNIAHPIRGPLRDASLALASAATGQTIWQGATDSLEQFLVPGENAGLYILEIRESQLHVPKSFFQIDDAIAIEISRDAAQADLNVELTMTSCGLSYTSGCSEGHLVATKACGSVLDSEGAAVGGAEILLYGVGDTNRRKVQSGADGSFDLGGVPPGEYRLSVGRPEFSSVNLGLTLSEVSESPRCEKLLWVRLEMAGRCSSAALEKH